MRCELSYKTLNMKNIIIIFYFLFLFFFTFFNFSYLVKSRHVHLTHQWYKTNPTQPNPTRHIKLVGWVELKFYLESQ